MYDSLSRNLTGYEHTTASTPRHAGRVPPTQGAELLSANGNRLSRLLEPSTLAGVDAELDALRRIGIKGVTLGIKLPLLLPTYTPDAPRYTQFYAAVADHARARGVAVSVELGALFCGTVFATCDYTWPSDIAGFAALTTAQARIVIDQVHPNYLTILAEASTEATLTGIRGFDTPTGAAAYVREVLDALGDRGGTKVGAGAGSWMPLSFDRLIAREPVDYLDTHIYPATPTIAHALNNEAQLSRAQDKPLVVDEVWLYKAAASPAGASAPQVERASRLDTYDFFAPLDKRFLTATRTWARKAGVLYESAFWSPRFFAYAHWTPELESSTFAQVSNSANIAAAVAMRASGETASGRAWAS